MTRVRVTPGRDLSKPLVEINETASLAQRLGLWVFRGYLALVIIIGILCVIAGVVFLLTL